MGAVFFAAPVFAQNMNSSDARLDRMEREMQTLSRAVYKGDVPPPSIMSGSISSNQQNAQTELRLNQIEDQLRRLTGMIEEANYKLRKLEENPSASVNANPAVQDYTNTNQPVLSTPSASDSGLTVSDQPYQLGTLKDSTATTPASLYDQAFSYLQKNDYASAQASFDDFIAKYPDHSLAANSKYWLAETYYARENYEKASQAFARSFKDHPDGQKAPDTLLKLAMSLKAQNMNDEACLTLAELAKRFPNAPASLTEKASSERASYGCGA